MIRDVPETTPQIVVATNGPPALSKARLAKSLESIHLIEPRVRGVYAEFVHFLACATDLTAQDGKPADLLRAVGTMFEVDPQEVHPAIDRQLGDEFRGVPSVFPDLHWRRYVETTGNDFTVFSG